MRAGTKARGEELKSTLVDATVARLAACGLPGLTTRQLAADAHCGAGTIGYLFGSLDQLVLVANDRTLADIADAMDASLHHGRAASQVERMQALALVYLDYACRHRHRWEALFLHRLPQGAVLPDWYRARREELFGKIAAVLGHDAPACDTAGGLARMVFAAVHGVVLLGLEQKLGDADDMMLREQVKTLVGLLAAGLLTVR